MSHAAFLPSAPTPAALHVRRRQALSLQRRRRSAPLVARRAAPSAMLAGDEDGGGLSLGELFDKLAEDDLQRLKSGGGAAAPGEDDDVAAFQGAPILNVVAVTGRFGRDPETRELRDGVSVTNCSMAFTHDWDDGLFELTDPNGGGGGGVGSSWIEVEAWNQLGTRMQRLGRKGLRVGITGKLIVNEWVGRDGNGRRSHVLRAKTFEVLQSRNEAEGMLPTRRVSTSAAAAPPSSATNTSNITSSPNPATSASAATNDGLEGLPF